MGSAYEWNEECSILCNHTIPAEIVAKIKNKMFAGERFTAYIVIPMWPEGDPCSAPMQAILYWQTRTIEMMYREVGRSLREANVPPHLGQHPTDWLIFLCPGKRELYGPHMDLGLGHDAGRVPWEPHTTAENAWLEGCPWCFVCLRGVEP